MADNDESRVSPQDGQLRAAALTVAAFFGVALLIGVAALAYALLGGGGDNSQPGPLTAVIVDQLELTYPNPEFVDEATQTLRDAGYAVDYVPGEDVTVDFYRDLPSQGYDMVVLRIHAARNTNNQTGTEILLPELFTAEPYSLSEHTWEREQGYLGPVVYYGGDEEMFFGIGPAFVAARMRGDFGGATVVMMGCNGLISDQMAEAFIRRGAGAFVSWDDLVSAAHTDAATLSLLGHMLVDELSPNDAAVATMADVGPDPYYDSVLLSYPAEE